MSNNLINNKVKQAKGGNWGKPDKTEQKKAARLPDEIISDYNDYMTALGANVEQLIFPVKAVAKKKKKVKKEKKPYYLWACPFCGEEIPKKPDDKKNKHLELVFNREDHCKCGAIEVKECPACKRSTWWKEGIYKHILFSCGFWGKKKGND